MSYAKQALIDANDYNSLAGITGSAAPSAAAATRVAGYLWGIGFGDRGYGQTAPTLSNVTAGNIIASWANFQQILSNLATWQNTGTTLLPAASQFATGADIEAFPAGQTPSVVDFLALLDTNRLNYQIANMSLTNNAASSTRASAWGGGNTSITCEFSVTFASEDAARFFFNTGGELRIALAHSNTTTSQNTAWRDILLNSNFAFRANSSARISGSNGAGTSIGYYQLTTTYQTIIDGTGIFVTPYASNSFVIQARAVAIPGVNGGKGSSLQFRVTLTDGYTSAFSDSVASGTSATVSHIRAGAILSSLPAAPTCSIITNF